MGTAFLYGNGGSGGTGAALTVTAPVGATVTVSKDGKIKTKVADSTGVAVFKGLSTGEWTVIITNATDTASDTVQLVADYTKEMSFVKIYGICRDITASSPAWAREDDAVGKSATASVGTVSGSSDFDSCYPWSGIQRETLSTGDVMVKIPKFWFRRYREGNIEHIKIADKPADGFTLHPAFNHAGVEKDCLYVGAYETSDSNRSVSGAAPQSNHNRATFRNNAKAKGSGWGLMDISAVSAIQMLILVEFATNNVQAVIGRGNCDNGSTTLVNTGSCDAVPNLTGRAAGTDGKTCVVWRGIENVWGNIWELTDGVNVNNDVIYVCNDPSAYVDDTTSGYERLSFTIANVDKAYITQEGLDTGGNTHVMLPSAAVGGSETTYFCDGLTMYATGWKPAVHFGSANDGSGSGIFAEFSYYATAIADGGIGGRLQYIPQ